MTGRSDLQLVEEFKQGNEAAFNEIVLRYQERVYWITRRMVGNHHAADDVTQDVFIKAYESLREFRGDSSLYTWLYRIATNLSLNAIRRQRVKEFFRLDDVLHLQEEGTPDPVESLQNKEQSDLILEALKTLPDKQRTTFVLRYYEELPYEEIANVMGTTVGGLKANFFHAVKKVGEYVKSKYA